MQSQISEEEKQKRKQRLLEFKKRKQQQQQQAVTDSTTQVSHPETEIKEQKQNEVQIVKDERQPEIKQEEKKPSLSLSGAFKGKSLKLKPLVKNAVTSSNKPQSNGIQASNLFDVKDETNEQELLQSYKRQKVEMEVDQQPEVEQQQDGDSLELFMKNVEEQVKKEQKQQKFQKPKQQLQQEEEDENEYDFDSFRDRKQREEEEELLLMVEQRAKKKDLQLIDHSKIKYEPFKRDFYVESPFLKSLSKHEVEMLREDLDNIQVRGKNCPKPCPKWTFCGLPLQVEHVLKQQQFETPTPIQAQAMPAIMSGRDVIGVAKTGSGKTLAFVLPMLRHIKDQRPLEHGDGPIGFIMTPTRELALQITAEIKKFIKSLDLRVVCAYGGAPIQDQIAEFKRGTEITVGTPGRLIDLLCANNGRVLNLKRVTYLVLDEADRMFDLGFETQVMRIVANVRPDAQRVLFSATFPKAMESLARRVLVNPVEIIVGGKSVVCNDVKQIVEVLEEDQKFVKLLEILGQWSDDAKNQRMLIFVDRQEAADELLKDLLKRGYACLSLHGGKDQMDRDSTLSDFKSGVCRILIATSVAARGLDVKNLNMVVNYECPNHKEDYVHRVGRTGRAGKKGTAYTFITPEQEKYAPEIYAALSGSKARIPTALKEMKERFLEKVKRGEAQLPGSGFGGKGLERIEKEREIMKQNQKTDFEVSVMKGEEEQDEPLETENKVTMDIMSKLSKAAELARHINQTVSTYSGMNRENEMLMQEMNAQTMEAQALAAEFAQQSAVNAGVFEEIEINDYPVAARNKVTSKDVSNSLIYHYKVALTVRGVYVPPGRTAPNNEKKLHVVLSGESRSNVEKAKLEVFRCLNEFYNPQDYSQMNSEEISKLKVVKNVPHQGRYKVI